MKKSKDQPSSDREDDLRFLEEDRAAYNDRMAISIAAAKASKTEIEHTRNIIRSEIAGIEKNIGLLKRGQGDAKKRYQHELKEKSSQLLRANAELHALDNLLTEKKHLLDARNASYAKKKKAMQTQKKRK